MRCGQWSVLIYQYVLGGFTSQISKQAGCELTKQARWARFRPVCNSTSGEHAQSNSLLVSLLVQAVRGCNKASSSALAVAQRGCCRHSVNRQISSNSVARRTKVLSNGIGTYSDQLCDASEAYPAGLVFANARVFNSVLAWRRISHLSSAPAACSCLDPEKLLAGPSVTIQQSHA